MNTAVQDAVERQITVRAKKERVFNAIADPEQIIAWFPDRVEGKFEVGERPIICFGDNYKVQLYVVANEPYDYFAYRWVPADGDADTGYVGDVLTQPNTLVEFRLTESAAGTTVTLKESGFASLPEETAAKLFKGNTDGWKYMIDRLETLMNQQ